MTIITDRADLDRLPDGAVIIKAATIAQQRVWGGAVLVAERVAGQWLTVGTADPLAECDLSEDFIGAVVIDPATITRMQVREQQVANYQAQVRALHDELREERAHVMAAEDAEEQWFEAQESRGADQW